VISDHFQPTALALAAHKAITAPSPSAEARHHHDSAALDQVARSLATHEIEAGEAHEQTEEVVIADQPRAGSKSSDVSLQNRRLAILVGSRIRAAREANGIAQFELAKAIGHQNSAQPSLWEAGRRLIPMTDLARVAKALDTTADYLLGLTDDMDGDPAEVRRGLLVQHLRDQLEAVASTLAGAVLESGLELEGAMRSTQLMTRCADVQQAVSRFRSANADAFEDMPAGALLVRSVRELAEAATAVGAELDGLGLRRERAARMVKTAMVAGAL